MTDKAPLISVIMPAYNAEKYIGEAIESILNQTLKDFELIIINDASTDSTGNIIKSYAEKDSRIVVLVNENNLNIAGSLNRGISVAKGTFIARMDADDIALPERLEMQAKVMSENPQVAVVGNDIQLINESGVVIGYRHYPTDSKSLKRVIFRYSPFAHPTVLIRAACIKEVGDYDKTKSPSEDVDMWFRLGMKYDFKSIPKGLLKYRVFLNSTSNKSLRRVELLTFKMRLNAVAKLGYSVGPVDVVYNILQFLSMHLMNSSTRVRLFNFLRNRKII